MNVYMTRQPIFDRDGSVFAYELLYRETEGAEDNSAADGVIVANDFFGINVANITGGEKAFVRFTDELIRQGAARKFSPEILVFEVTQKQLGTDWILETVRSLKESGYRIALDEFDFDNADTKLLELADIVKIDIKRPKEDIEKAGIKCHKTNTLLLAKNAHTNSDFEHAVRYGCKFLQGYFYARSSVMSGDTIHPLPVNLLQVMRLMAQPEPEFDEIVDVMSRDAALCQKILKLINSVYFGISNKVSSINQAILILGLNYLREWVYLMGMQRISQNDCIEVMRLALLIAKFCRGMSKLIPDQANNGDAFYLMGLLSMIVLSSDRDLARALDEFPLANDIKKGLLRCGGVYSDVFEMALSYVDGRWDEFEYTARKYGFELGEISDMFIKYLHEIGKMNMS